jgi:hypothetical protein
LHWSGMLECFARKVRIPLFMMRDVVYRAPLSLAHTSVVLRPASCNNMLEETSRELLKAHLKWVVMWSSAIKTQIPIIRSKAIAQRFPSACDKIHIITFTFATSQSFTLPRIQHY